MNTPRGLGATVRRATEPNAPPTCQNREAERTAGCDLHAAVELAAELGSRHKPFSYKSPTTNWIPAFAGMIGPANSKPFVYNADRLEYDQRRAG